MELILRFKFTLRKTILSVSAVLMSLIGIYFVIYRGKFDDLLVNLIASLEFSIVTSLLVLFISQNRRKTEINTFSNFEEFHPYLREFIKKINACKESEKPYLVTILSPFSFDEKSLRYLTNGTRTASIISNDLVNLSVSLSEWIQSSSSNCKDRTIFGRTGDSSLDHHTGSFVIKTYRGNRGFPGTTSFGIHSNMNEMFEIYILNENTLQHEMMLRIRFSEGFTRISGFCCYDHIFIAAESKGVEQKIEEVRERGLLVDKQDCEEYTGNEEIDRILKEGPFQMEFLPLIEKFYFYGIPKNQMPLEMANQNSAMTEEQFEKYHDFFKIQIEKKIPIS